ncbi:hypothetical protein H5410_036951 [Solanum commersonii]|uniref:Uncharacterized protein n=1 Tax=Solanum commersonii TaxID=4109 RepID=A0A9J5Y747_SOLCO|nr:hypothetical protein H5410_036951 [Solanum commersonii]
MEIAGQISEAGSAKTMQRRVTSTSLKQISTTDSSEIPAINNSDIFDLWRQECEEVISETQHKETNTGATKKDTVRGVIKATTPTKEKPFQSPTELDNYRRKLGGDFNIIMEESEKLGGLSVTQSEVEDFVQCMNVCALLEIKFSVHVTCSITQEQVLKPFRFLNFWTKHKKFQQIVEEVWKEVAAGSPFTIVHTKLKRVKLALVAILEDIVKAKEMQLEINQTEENRTSLRKAEAKLKRYLHIEEDYWKQKAGMKWFQKGDKNTMFFHAYVKGRRRKLQISEIKSR